MPTSPALRYLRAVRRFGLAVADPDDPSVAAALDALDAVRAEADGDPPLIVRLARAVGVDDVGVRVLEAVAGAVEEGELGVRFSHLCRAVDAPNVVSAALRPWEDAGVLRLEEAWSADGAHAHGVWTTPVADVLLDPAPSDNALEGSGLAALLESAPFDAEREGLGSGPFADDLDYFEAAAALVRLWGERHDAEHGVDILGGGSGGARSLARRDRADHRVGEARAALAARVGATRRAGRPLPRLEALGDRLGLGVFERDVLLYLCCAHARPSLSRHGSTPDVEDLVDLLTPTFRAGVEARRAFYRDGPLLTEGLVEVEVHRGSLNRAAVVVDPAMVDWLLGLETEAGALHDGSHLFAPAVRLADVHLPEDQKARVVEATAHAGAFRRARAELGLDDRLAYGRGLVFLFHGPPGTGKTMLAHALAAELGKRLLLVNEGPGFFQSGERLFRYLLREARLADAVLFFDEAEAFFGGHDVALLTEIERHDGLVVLATNKPEAIDPAMRRRCTVSVRFEEPGPALRERIWEGLLPEAARAPDVDPAALAERYALPGGHVKNAVLTAVAAAAARAERGGGPVVLGQADLERAAVDQVRARLAGRGTHAAALRGGLDRLVLDDAVDRALRRVVALERARPAALREWGFGDGPAGAAGGGLYGRSTAVLLEGPPGTGKTAAAEALAFELGRPLHLVTAADVADKYVGETAKRLRAAFAEAAGVGAVLLLDEADALLAARGDVRTSTDRYANADTNVLLGLIERHDGLVVLTTNRSEGLDPALARRLWLRLRLDRPGPALRARLWRAALPSACPLAGDVDLGALAEAHALTGAEIERAAYRAAAAAATRADERRVCQADLAEAAGLEGGRAPAGPIGFTLSPAA